MAFSAFAAAHYLRKHGWWILTFEINLPWEVENALYLAVGAIIINWGVVDSAVAQTCALLVQLGGHKAHSKAPKAFRLRLDLIKRCFRDDPRLSDMAQISHDVRQQTKEIVPHRDFIIHGVLTGWEPKTRTFWFTKLDTDKVSYQDASTALTIEKLLELSQASAEVAKNWLLLLERLHAIRNAENSN